jgi:hypothetical protein
MSYVLSADTLVAHLERETVLLHARSREYYRLNETGQAICRMLEAGCAESDIAAALAPEYDVPLGTAQQEVADLLGELVREHLAVAL